jgi:hypothetical protein
LVNGDIDGDNEVSVLDYNIFVFCYYGYFCDDYYKVSDLNDNGKIDEIDYNLLLREYPAQIGD